MANKLKQISMGVRNDGLISLSFHLDNNSAQIVFEKEQSVEMVVYNLRYLAESLEKGGDISKLKYPSGVREMDNDKND